MCGDEIIITTDDNRLRRTLSCSFWLFLHKPRCLWKSLTVVLLLPLLCLITDYHCHLLSSICYCTNDEMNPFKQHLNRWQKPQLLQWLSPLISNHFSNLHQSHLLASTFFLSPSPESHQMRLRMGPKLPKQASSVKWREGGGKKKRKNTITGNKWEKTSFYILRWELKGMQMSSHPSPSQVTGMSRPWKPLQYNYTPSYLPPKQSRCCSNRSVAISDPSDSRRRTQGNRIFNKALLLCL